MEQSSRAAAGVYVMAVTIVWPLCILANVGGSTPCPCSHGNYNRLLQRGVKWAGKGFWRGVAKTDLELGSGFAVAGEAEGAEVGEVTLPAALGYGPDVVGVPEGAAAGDGLHSVEGEAGGTCGTAGALEGGEDGDGVGVAEGADAAIAGEDLVAEVAGVSAETPLVDTVVGAEGAASFGEDFKLAPAAEG